MGLNDEELMAFIYWCRVNDPTVVFDIAVARRTYDAYCGATDKESHALEY